MCIAVGLRASMYGDVQCRKAHSYCVQRRILLARTWAYGDVRRRMPTCGNLRRRKSSYVDAGLCRCYNVTVIYCNMPHKLSSCAACCIRRRTTMQRVCERARLRRPVLNLLKAGNRAVESVWFMTQCASRSSVQHMTSL